MTVARSAPSTTPRSAPGGMLTVADEHLHGLNPSASTALFGQEINPRTYAICKADLLIKGQDPTNVRQGDTLVVDRFEDQKFDYVLSNPPFGTDWKAVASEVTAEHERGGQGRFAPGLPGVGDAAMLFLLHVASKMRPVDDTGRGGKAGIVLNGSPLFNGGAGTGPSDIRGHMLENDLVEAIVALPNDMFYNTGIATYLWILSNAKPDRAQGHRPAHRCHRAGHEAAQVDRLQARRGVRRRPRRHRADASPGGRRRTTSKVFENRDFAYWTITVERPLRLRFQCTAERIQDVADHKTLGKITDLVDALGSFGDRLYLNREKFLRDLGKHLRCPPGHADRGPAQDAMADDRTARRRRRHLPLHVRSA